MLFKNKLLNIFFAAELVLFGLIIIGILPRETALFMAGALALYVISASLEDSVVLFVMSIPLFLALPLTASFDNFNTWRILSTIIFLKWLTIQITNHKSQITTRLKIQNLRLENKLLIILLALAALSVIPAGDKITAIKRIIYFVNLSFIGIVIYDLAKNNIEFSKRLIKSIAIPTIIVAVVGFVQVAMTYLIDIYQFMRLWGEGIQCRQFGNEWCTIAVWKGNTWFAYFGEQLSLRVFSLFPDSHSFPQFALLGLASIFAIALPKAIGIGESLKKIIRTRASMHVLWIPFIFLITILSGTRGIWAASAGVLIIVFGILIWLKRYSDKTRLNTFSYISSYLIVFFVLFAIAYPIFVSPQFLVSKGDFGMFGNRIKSILDFGETSNSQRIEIWKKSSESIVHHPILGVGIGNFPVVLSQDIRLSRAGSSAHNLYLNIAAEMGIFALFATIGFLWLIFYGNLKLFSKINDSFLRVYFGATLIFVPWVLIYSLTDVAIFDERAFLLFVTVLALLLSAAPKIKDPFNTGL